MKRAKKPAPRRPRRVVLGVGHPWFMFAGMRVTHVALSSKLNRSMDVGLKIRDLCHDDRIRLIAEVLK